MLILPASCHPQDRANNKVKEIYKSTFISPDSSTDYLKIDSTYVDAPSAITRNIIQDKDGIFWFATFEGIIKYDGKSFINLTKGQSIRFFSVLEAKNGLIWFGSIGAGIYRYDGSCFQILTTEDGLVDDRVTNIYEDNLGRIWFGTVGGISIYDGSTFTNMTTEEGLLDNDINSIMQDPSGLYWVGTRGKAFTYDGSRISEIMNEDGASFYNVRHIMRDLRGHMWMGGNDGLWRYDGETYNRISRNFTGYIYEDRVGNIWTSSVHQDLNAWTISQYDVISLNNGRPTATEIKTREGMFFGILEDENKDIWAGKLDGVIRISQHGSIEEYHTH